MQQNRYVASCVNSDRCSGSWAVSWRNPRKRLFHNKMMRTIELAINDANQRQVDLFPSRTLAVKTCDSNFDKWVCETKPWHLFTFSSISFPFFHLFTCFEFILEEKSQRTLTFYIWNSGTKVKWCSRKLAFSCINIWRDARKCCVNKISSVASYGIIFVNCFVCVCSGRTDSTWCVYAFIQKPGCMPKHDFRTIMRSSCCVMALFQSGLWDIINVWNVFRKCEWIVCTTAANWCIKNIEGILPSDIYECNGKLKINEATRK